jgi:hypothetical protein
MQCSNNLKQLGLAVHNFHDSRNGLPPVSIGAANVGVLCLLYPYIEQGALYDLLQTPRGTTVSNIGSNTYGGGGSLADGGHGLMALPNNCEAETWWLFLSDDLKTSFGSIPAFACPSRGGPGFLDLTPAMSISGGNAGSNCGPISAYIAVLTKKMDRNGTTFILPGGGNTGTAAVAASNVPYTRNDYFARWQDFCVDGWNVPATEPYCGATAVTPLYYVHGVKSFDSPLRSSELLSLPSVSISDAAITPTGYTYRSGDPGFVAQSYVTGWAVRDSFAYWADGASNQIVFGEKNVPHFALNPCDNIGDPENVYRSWQGTYGMGGWVYSNYNVSRIAGTARLIGPDTALASGPTDSRVVSSAPATIKVAGHPAYTELSITSGEDYGFGSAHTSGVLNWLFGDGSVHSASSTVNTQDVLYPLCSASDGAAAQLP